MARLSVGLSGISPFLQVNLGSVPFGRGIRVGIRVPFYLPASLGERRILSFRRKERSPF
jgi:hypothetical protein